MAKKELLYANAAFHPDRLRRFASKVANEARMRVSREVEEVTVQISRSKWFGLKTWVEDEMQVRELEYWVLGYRRWSGWWALYDPRGRGMEEEFTGYLLGIDGKLLCGDGDGHTYAGAAAFPEDKKQRTYSNLRSMTDKDMLALDREDGEYQSVAPRNGEFVRDEFVRRATLKYDSPGLGLSLALKNLQKAARKTS